MRRAAAHTEEAVVTLAATGVIVLPLAEVVLRRLFATGIPGAALFTEHLTMWVGMLGAAIAARDGKLLTISTGTLWGEGRPRQIAQVFAAMVGGMVAVIFAVGGTTLLRFHLSTARQIAVGMPVWVADLALPVAFGLIALRLMWRCSPSMLGRAVAATGIVAGVWISQNPELFDGRPAWPWIVVMIAAAIAGAPIFSLLGGCAIFLFMAQGDRPATLLVKSYEQLTSTDLAAIPLFTLAGFLLAEGKASERLIRLFRALVGWMPGGTAVVTATLCAFFTVFTGGSGVTILALGGLLLPALIADGYRDRFSLGLLTAAGSLGLLFPPALPLILYGIVAEVPMGDLFLGGLLPGVVMLALLSALGVREGLRSNAGRVPFRGSEAAAALWGAKWEIGLPIVILGSLFGAGATTVQSSALAALYALVVQRFVHRDIPSMGDLRRVMSECSAVVGGVLIILAVAVGLTNYLVNAQIPAQMIEWTRANIQSPAVFLLGLNLFLIVVGCLMDIFSAIIVVVPLIVPIAAVFGIDPIHLGIIFVANLELGYLTPPVGLNLFLSSYRFKRPVLEVARATLPMLAILAVGVLLITYLPWLTLALVRWLGSTL